VTATTSASDRSRDRAGDRDQVGRRQLQVEAPAPTADEHGALLHGGLVQDRGQGALLTDGADPADDIARAAFGRSGIRHHHPLDAEGVRQGLEVQLPVDGHDADGQPGPRVDEQGLEDARGVDAQRLGRLEPERRRRVVVVGTHLVRHARPVQGDRGGGPGRGVLLGHARHCMPQPLASTR